MKKQICLLIIMAFCFTLPASAEQALDVGKIVVTPSKLEEKYEQLPVNVSIIDNQVISDSGSGGIAQLLDRLPSVNIIDYGADGSTKTVHTRGLSGAQILTLVDGIPMHTPRDGVADLNRIDLNNVEKIEVLRGPASNIYGSNAMGGVINIITKDGKSFPKTKIESKYGSFDTRGLSFAHGKDLGCFDYYLSHDTYKTNGFRENGDYEYHNTSLKLGCNPRENNRLNFGYNYYQAELGTPGDNFWADPDDRQETWQQNLNLSWRCDLTEDTNLLMKVYNNTDRLEFIENAAGDDVDAHQTKIYGEELQLAQQIFDLLRLTVGYNRQDLRLNSSASGKYRSFVNACYAEGELDPLENLKLYFGTRYDYYSNFGSKFSPSVRFSWWLNDNYKLHGLYGHSFRAPTYNDLYWPREDWGIWGGVEGNSQLGPEKAKSYEVGISGYFLDSIWADLTYFRNHVDDLILWNMDNTYWWRPENISSALIQGMELNSDFVIAHRLKTNLNYTLLYAKDKDTKKWLIYRPRHQYKLGLNYKTENGWTLDWAWRYVTKRFIVNDNTNCLSSYWLADASISKKFMDFWELQLSANNLFDQDYEEEAGYPMPGTQILTSVKCEF